MALGPYFASKFYKKALYWGFYYPLKLTFKIHHWIARKLWAGAKGLGDTETAESADSDSSGGPE